MINIAILRLQSMQTYLFDQSREGGEKKETGMPLNATSRVRGN